MKLSRIYRHNRYTWLIIMTVFFMIFAVVIDSKAEEKSFTLEKIECTVPNQYTLHLYKRIAPTQFNSLVEWIEQGLIQDIVYYPNGDSLLYDQALHLIYLLENK